MANQFAWASIGENGKATGGKKGDQTGREVKVGDYYEFGQNWVVRFVNSARGKKCAKACKLLAQNDNIGYNQNDRVSLYRQCEYINWDIELIDSIMPCNCDCSELYVCAVNFAYGKAKLPASMTTSKIPIIVSKYPANFKFSNKSILTGKFHKGDAVGKTGHVIINV